jgi:hypothetical protein
MKEGSIFYCPTISNIMTWKYFMSLNRCLHITNPLQYVKDKELLGYAKLGQI